MFLIKVPEEGRFLTGGIHRTRVGGGTGMAGGASRDSMRRIFSVMSVVFVMACRPRHQDDCLVERMGIVGKGWETVCVVLHLGRGRHVAGSRKLETMGLHMHPHPHVSRFLGSRRRRAGSGCICGPYRRLIDTWIREATANSPLKNPTPPPRGVPAPSQTRSRSRPARPQQIHLLL